MESTNEATCNNSELPPPVQLEGAAAGPDGVDGEDNSARPLAAPEETKEEAAAGEDVLQEKLLHTNKFERRQLEEGSPNLLSRVLLIAAALAAVGVATAGAAVYGRITFASPTRVESQAAKELRKLQVELHKQKALVVKLKSQAEQAEHSVSDARATAARALHVRNRPPEEAACAKEFEACDIIGSTNCCQSGCTCQGDANYKMCKPVNTLDSCLSSLEVTLQGELEEKQVAVNHSDRAAKTAADILAEATSKLERINKRVEEARSALEAEEARKAAEAENATSHGGANASTAGQRLHVDRGATSGRAVKDANSLDEDGKKDGDSWDEDWK